MTRISHVDQVLLLLRERLQRAEKGRAGRTGKAAPPRRSEAKPMERLQARAALESMGEEEFRRTMVRALLTDEFGEGLANDAAFQQVVDRVYRILGEDEDGRALLARAERQLRG